MSQATIQKRFYSIREVQEICEVSRKTVCNWIESGKIPAPIKMGHLVKWPIKTIEDWIDAGCPSQESGE